MATSITYTSSCAERLIQFLRAPSLRVWETSYISGVLNKQLKSAMSTIIQDSTREVLEKLEKELKRRGKKVWADCFCTICILFLCAEEVQIATQGFIMHNIANGYGGSTSSDEGVETCKNLDIHPFTHLMELFHGVYHSRKQPIRHRPSHVFNPLRDGVEAYNNNDFDQSSVDLVNGVRLLIFQHCRPHYVPGFTGININQGRSSRNEQRHHHSIQDTKTWISISGFVIGTQGDWFQSSYCLSSINRGLANGLDIRIQFEPEDKTPDCIIFQFLSIHWFLFIINEQHIF